jgi:hypothetical protein
MDIKKYFIATCVSLFGLVGLANAALLGVAPGFPNTVYDNQGTINYNNGTMALDVDATPLTLQFTNGGATFFSGERAR